MRLDLISAAACLGLASCASAVDRPEVSATEECLAWQSVILATREADPNSEMIDLVEGSDAQQMLAALNSMPPVSHLGGDHIAIVFQPGDDRFLFIAGERGCATGIVQIPREALQQSMGITI
jgi:hypothetical protein